MSHAIEAVKDRALYLSLAHLAERGRALHVEDRAILAKLWTLLLTTEDEEEIEEAFKSIVELCEAEPMTLIDWPAGDVAGLRSYTVKVGARIRAARLKAGLSQDQLADAAGLRQSHVSRLEKGDHSPSGLTLEKLARALGTTSEHLAPPLQSQAP